MNSVAKSNFGNLVSYLTDEQGKQERVADVSITNCVSESINDAIDEITNTQIQNTRAESDKTYHLIVSFPVGEDLDSDTLALVEERICDGLGFGEHQRVSVVHSDTDNLHIHIAINKIHPKTFTIHNPYNDYWVRDNLCKSLENELGLQKDNHKPSLSISENRANDMERHSGIQSLVSWVKANCLQEIQKADSWESLHKTLASHGLEIKERANGLVIVDSHSAIGVKASTISRDISKSNLEKKLGGFVSNQSPSGIGKKVRYEKKPVSTKIDSILLYATYKTEQHQNGAQKISQMQAARRDRDRAIVDAKKKAALKREQIKLLTKGRLAKKALYSMVSASLKNDIQKAQANCKAKTESIAKVTKRNTWADWLRLKAIEGNTDALAVLRSREAAKGLKGDTLSGFGEKESRRSNLNQDGVTKKGTIIYRSGAVAIRDDGDRINVSSVTNQESITKALELAMSRYGNQIQINGSDEFKAKVAQAAAKANLPLSFTDPSLEKQRIAFLNNQKEINDGRRRTDSGRNAGIGSTSTRAGDSNRPGLGAGLGGGFGTSAQYTKPHVSGVGRNPPPQAKDRLRTMSQLGVVRIASGAQVLLPSNVSGGLEHKRDKPTYTLRWAVSGAGGVAAAEKYIKEREEKRSIGITIDKHIQYNDKNNLDLRFGGIRNVDGESLVLLKTKDEIMVLPITKAEAQRLKKLDVNARINIGSSVKKTISR